MDKIVPAFETTLFDSTLSDACVDMAELGIDSLLDDGVFKSVPIFSFKRQKKDLKGFLLQGPSNIFLTQIQWLPQVFSLIRSKLCLHLVLPL